MKGGFGIATAQEHELSVCAAAAVNSVGDVLNEDGSVLAGARMMKSKTSDGRWLVEMDPYRRFHMTQASWGTNTTLLVVATNASLDKVSVNRLAQRAQDGLAIAVRPAHTTRDGDTAFALATGKVEVSFDLVANVAVAVVAEAIRNGVRHAATIGEIEGLAG
jgi:L-aminopeptidase/D-esterase-like protein